MRRRPRGGSSPASASVVNRKLLSRRLESYKHDRSTVEELVRQLCDAFPEYRRIKRHPFANAVREALESFSQKERRQLRSPSSREGSGDDDDEEEELERVGSSRKKSRRTDAMEERLQRFENDYIQRKRPRSSQEDSSSEPDDEEDGDEEDGDASTSEDAIYEEKVEPEFDLMKSMLRASYVGEAAKPGKAKQDVKERQEKNIEVEISPKKPRRAIDMTNASDAKSEAEAEAKGGGSGSGWNEGVTVKGKEGPRFKDLGGMKEVLEELKMEVIVPLYHPHLPRMLGVSPMAGILLHGPPGCGKTKLAHAIANETGVPFYKISATEIVSGVSGASEENIRDLFLKAHKTAPSIVFIDEIDAIASKRENLQREMERRIVTQLMTCMDELHRPGKSTDKNADTESADTKPSYVLVIGATNRPDAVDPALRRPGRFDREIGLGVPDENARVEILSVLTRALKLEGSFNFHKIARSTPGFVGADLAALANKAGNLAMKRILDERKLELSKNSMDVDSVDEWWRQPWLPEEMEKLAINMADFEEALKMIQPSSRREGFSAIPNVKWEDVGGLDSLRQAFDRYIVRRIKYPEDYEEFGVDLETGFLLFGPPGCGKTLIAKAVANEAGANFIHIKGPELLNKYVGESELAVRTLFSRARTCAPCILFFDEVDALTKQRGTEGGWVVERLLNQLLIELDGADHRRGVFVIGATNRIEVIDSALLRPGRFGKLHYVRLPSADERGLILKALGRKKPIDAGVDLEAIGQMEACQNLSGADLAALVNEAAMVALEEKLTLSGQHTDSPCTIKTAHFEQALTKISPSVSKMDIRVYEKLAEELKAA
ncbi:hypothetical protein ACJRO7_032366 [Eucalyptus globulus]|uniref:AAA+ ATPase domain-containing protein n=1 Tax=Eucalyptus globulus TaxID=34317 RepID=A0ABD3JN21_EUCGL